MSSLLKDLQKMVEDVVWVFGGFGRPETICSHKWVCLKHFPTVFRWGAHLDTCGCRPMYLLYKYEPYYLRNCQESAEQQSESWLVQKLIFSQSSFWGAILITQASLNILKLCISGGGLWRYSVQKIGGSVYII